MGEVHVLAKQGVAQCNGREMPLDRIVTAEASFGGQQLQGHCVWRSGVGCFGLCMEVCVGTLKHPYCDEKWGCGQYPPFHFCMFIRPQRCSLQGQTVLLLTTSHVEQSSSRKDVFSLRSIQPSIPLLFPSGCDLGPASTGSVCVTIIIRQKCKQEASKPMKKINILDKIMQLSEAFA